MATFYTIRNKQSYGCVHGALFLEFDIIGEHTNVEARFAYYTRQYMYTLDRKRTFTAEGAVRPNPPNS